MDSIKKSVTCQICQKVFINPVYIPECNNSCCLYHVEDALNRSRAKYISCFFCKKIHQIPLISELKINQLAQEIIKSNAHLDDNERNLKAKAILFNKELDYLFQKYILNIESDLELCFTDHFAKIRNTIEMQRKLLIDKINTKTNILLEQASTIEEKQKKILGKIKRDEILTTKLASLNNFKIDLDAQFCQPYFNLSQIETLNEKIKVRINTFREKLEYIEEFKLEMENISFFPCPVVSCFESLGQIVHVNKLNRIASCSQDGNAN